jgi:DnaJ homolog subfamily B member 12
MAGPFGPNVRIHTFGGGRPRRAYGAAPNPPRQANNNSSIFFQLLPILIVILFTALPAIFNSTSIPTPTPSFVFVAAQPPYTLERTTPHHHIPYFVNPDDISSLSNVKLRQLDQKAEVTFVRGLRDQCQYEHNLRQQKMADAQSWLGQVKDKEAFDEARKMTLPSCERLSSMGYAIEMEFT